MYLPCRWEVLIILWIHLGFVPGQDGTVNHLSKEDVLLLKDEESPKCFSRTEDDFTCFFETSDNSTYDLFYNVCDRTARQRCELSVRRTKEDTFLHICSFPSDDICVYVETCLEVVKRNTNTSLYKREVSVEDHILLDPPYNVSFHQNGQVGQLQVTYTLNVAKYLSLDNVIYRIRYYSKGLGEKTKEVSKVDKLDSLVPGEEVEVQVNAKYQHRLNTGHWSSWSQPVRAMVPQSADDISLTCYTSDLQNITCQWDKLRYGVEDGYKLFYKIGLSTTDWTECLTDRNMTYLCCFHGDEFRKMRVKLNSTSAPLSRTFYTQEFTLNNSIKTSPPSHLKARFEKDKLCLNAEAPLPSLAAHLQYEVSYQIQEGEWLSVSPKGPETDICLDVPMSSQYRVRIRAKPTGHIYSGHWSDWSRVLHGHTPTDRGKWLMLCIPALMLIPAIIVNYLFPMYLSKIKLYFWPPVPNPDKVLQGFLTEMKGQKWNPPLTAKQLSEETTCSSVVEIMSEGEVSALGKPSEESTELLSPERGFSGIQWADGSPGTEVFPDYVTLNKDSVILCSKGKKYVEEEAGEKEGLVVKDDLLETCHAYCTEGSVCTPACLGTDFLNHSYWPLVDKVAARQRPGNVYTNFPCS